MSNYRFKVGLKNRWKVEKRRLFQRMDEVSQIKRVVESPLDDE